jgi:hypothetical protein
MSRGRDARWATWFRAAVAAGSAATLGVLGLTGNAMAATGGTAQAAAPASAATLADDSSSTCHLGNGVKHVVSITFDNVHYFRDNPNVPSDLELMPNLLHFIEGNGTMLSNNHTPLIAHTADDILTTLTGLYGDRQGMPISNAYKAYNANGPGGSFNTTDPAGSFAYWTDPVFNTATTPSPGHDTNPSMVYSPVPPATANTPVMPNTVTPAPWVPFTRAGCDVGDFSTANVELENTALDIPKVFGVGSPEDQQLASDSTPGKPKEVADYVGVAVHCAKGSAFCADAQGNRGNQTTPSPTAVADLLPDEPGGYAGYQGLFGAKYSAPQLGAGTPNKDNGHGYQVTNAAGNLVDLNGQQINGSGLDNYPGFPGFDPTASQTLAYAADMLEAGLPVVQTYIADIHGLQDIPSLDGPAGVCGKSPEALGSGDPCYLAQAAYYNQAFGTFFNRLAADGITPQNTLFIVSPDEGDHEAGANVGRVIQPQPLGCNGGTVSGGIVTPGVYCTYPAGTFGELGGNITGLLVTQKGNHTPFSLQNDTAPEFYVTGDPGPNDPTVRTLERDVSGLTANNPYAGGTQTIANYLADPAEEAILHMVNADPARTPTFALFAKPDYFLFNGGPSCPSAGCVTISPGFAWNHGAYAAEINTDWVGFAGPGVQNLGLDGQQPQDGPNSAGPNSGQEVVVGSGTTGTWVDETDLRPTMMYLTGLTDDYIQDGRVITEILSNPNHALSRPKVVEDLGACYKQLNSSVGQFGAFTLQASTAAVESSTAGDAKYQAVNAALTGLDQARDALAIQIKDALNAAAFQDKTVSSANLLTRQCQAVIDSASALAQHG